jgi:hypothetical protein
MKEILDYIIELIRLILGTILGVVLLIIVVSLCKFKELCGKK